MRILYITSALPYPPDSGSKIRSYQMLKYLAGKGRVTMVCPAQPAVDAAHVAALRPLCEELALVDETTFWFAHSQRRAPSVGQRLADLLRRESWAIQDFRSDALRRQLLDLDVNGFDLVVVRYPQMAAYLFDEPALKPALAKTVIDVDDVAVRSFERALAGAPLTYGTLRRRMDLGFLRRFYRQLSRARLCLAVSALDKAYLQERQLAQAVEVVPNMIETAQAAPERNGHAAVPSFLFVGLMSYPPNEEAAVYFCEQILPRIRAAQPEARITIAGRRPSARVEALGRLPGVTVTGAVLSIARCYEEASVAVVPLRNGSGTRIKILEAMALRTPVVTTTIGCEGLDVADGEHVLVADDAEAFARQCLALVDDADLRAGLIDRAQRLVNDRYSVPAFHRAMDAALSKAGWTV